MSLQTILVPVDGSEPSFRALDLAARLATSLGATLELVTVLDPTLMDVFESMNQTQAAQEAQVRATILTPALARLAEGGATHRTLILHGIVIKELQRHIQSTQPDLVVMGRTGRTAMNRILNGSVSQRLSSSCPVPITLVG